MRRERASRAVLWGVLAFLFTFVIPLALMTTYPAEAMLGRLPARSVAVAVLDSPRE